MSPYSSFSITITAMWAGAPPRMCRIGEGRRWTCPWRVESLAQAVGSAASASRHQSAGRRTRRRRITAGRSPTPPSAALPPGPSRSRPRPAARRHRGPRRGRPRSCGRRGSTARTLAPAAVGGQRAQVVDLEVDADECQVRRGRRSAPRRTARRRPAARSRPPGPGREAARSAIGWWAASASPCRRPRPPAPARSAARAAADRRRRSGIAALPRIRAQRGDRALPGMWLGPPAAAPPARAGASLAPARRGPRQARGNPHAQRAAVGDQTILLIAQLGLGECERGPDIDHPAPGEDRSSRLGGSEQAQ